MKLIMAFSPLKRPHQWFFITLLSLLSLQLMISHSAERIYLWAITHWQAEESRKLAVWLPDYVADIDGLAIREIPFNLSDITYDPQREILWTVRNDPTELIAMTTEGEVVDKYILEGFEDVEAITWAGDNTLVIGEERRQNLVIVPVDQILNQTDHQLYHHQFKKLTLAINTDDNKGFEGLSYDYKGDRLFITKERDPKQLLVVSGFRESLAGNFSLAIHNIQGDLAANGFPTDLSSVVFDDPTGHLILLSDESRLLLEITDAGEIISYRSLNAGFAGLRDHIPQAEGVTMDDAGTIYIISEPNLFYRLKRVDSSLPVGTSTQINADSSHDHCLQQAAIPTPINTQTSRI